MDKENKHKWSRIIPEAFLDKQYIIPWMQPGKEEIVKIIKNRFDMNPYGAHNEAAFFAVVSEYFFERPDELEQKNRELYQLLVEVFNQTPGE